MNDSLHEEDARLALIPTPDEISPTHRAKSEALLARITAQSGKVIDAFIPGNDESAQMLIQHIRDMRFVMQVSWFELARTLYWMYKHKYWHCFPGHESATWSDWYKSERFETDEVNRLLLTYETFMELASAGLDPKLLDNLMGESVTTRKLEQVRSAVGRYTKQIVANERKLGSNPEKRREADRLVVEQTTQNIATIIETPVAILNKINREASFPSDAMEPISVHIQARRKGDEIEFTTTLPAKYSTLIAWSSGQISRYVSYPGAEDQMPPGDFVEWLVERKLIKKKDEDEEDDEI